MGIVGGMPIAGRDEFASAFWFGPLSSRHWTVGRLHRLCGSPTARGSGTAAEPHVKLARERDNDVSAEQVLKTDPAPKPNRMIVAPDVSNLSQPSAGHYRPQGLNPHANHEYQEQRFNDWSVHDATGAA